MKLMTDEDGNRHLRAPVNVPNESSLSAMLDEMNEITAVRNVDLS